MNWTIEYQQEEYFVRITLEGHFSWKDHSQKVQEIISQDYWKPGMSILFDCRKIACTNTNFDLVNNLSENFIEYEKVIECGRIALLMKSTTDFGRARQFELLTNEKINAEINVFLDKDKAIEWLQNSVSESDDNQSYKVKNLKAD